ncbi:MAG: hypothetical protein HQ521_18815 [Bacteroidetes bacterium]|nr:hypothetical protein [Bacteroidota bacterium]
MRFILISLLSFVFSIYMYSQGCSDAGLCTITGLDSGYDDTKMKSIFKYSTIFGLGTYDMILGFGSIYKKWHLGFGYQHSFGHNLNEFEHRNDNPANFNNYNESYHLQRADDIMLRIERQFLIGNANYMFSVLPIYHLEDNKIK